MRHAVRYEIFASVNPTPYVTLALEFDLEADPVAGVVRTGAGSGEGFAGWLALTRVIERTLDDARNAASCASPIDAGTSAPDPTRSKS